MRHHPDSLADLIRTIPHFPTPSIEFRDITPILRDPDAFRSVVDLFAEQYGDTNLNTIVGMEPRGFLLSAPLAYRMGVSLVPARKLGHLPGPTYQAEYFGADAVEIHRDAVESGTRVLIVDDVLGSGRTVAAACEVVEMAGGVVAGVACVMELVGRKGRERLAQYDVFSLVQA